MKRNRDFDTKAKSIPKIISEHLFTLFNFINFVLAAALIIAGSYKNALFLGTVLCNFAIGVFWEIKAKFTLERLRLVTQSKVRVLRDGKEVLIDRGELKAGDTVLISAGTGIACDGVILSGKAKLDESSLTGEADPVEKTPGDTVLSGTVVLSGSAQMLAEKIGADCYAAGITKAVKGEGSKKSVMMAALNRIIFIISVVIVPIGGLMMFRQTQALDSIRQAVVTTAASLVGMIPDGLMLLTSTVLAIGVVKLARKKVLVQELYSIESLARTDVICLDKTGTLTTGNMTLEELIPFSDGFEEKLSLFSRATTDSGATTAALKAYFSAEPLSHERFIAFDSKKKFSALTVLGQDLVLGAGEFVGGLSSEQESLLKQAAKKGRALVLYSAAFDEKEERLDSSTLRPLGIVRLSDTLREGINKALDYFYSQKVQIKIISGDNVDTVEKIARDAGVRDAHKAIDTSLLSDEALVAACEENVVFARVTPERKKLIILTLKKLGHTVAMTGDGINDIQAMRSCDCAISPLSATDAAKNCASLVMLNDDFCTLPHVVAQGRQSIGNVERSSGVFLTKTVLSALLTFIFLIWGQAYPFQPIQLTLVSTTGIGITGFLLGLEPSRDRIQGNFLKKVFKNALPGGAVAAVLVTVCTALNLAGLIPSAILGGLCVLFTYLLVFSVLIRVMLPLNKYRLCVAAISLILFLGGFFILGDLFCVKLF